MSHRVLWALLAAGLAAGCQEQEPAPGGGGASTNLADASTAPQSPRGLGPLSEASTNPAVIADTGDVNATVQQLTQALRDYVVRSRSVPKNFEDFAAKSQVQFPPAPDGKRYAIQGQTVVLVKR
ncbi:MAG TPA: hypothetical protein VJA21_19655 [Verrucomicrobiae bacterium]